MSQSEYSFVDFKVIKSSVNILQILDRYGITATLKRNGDSLTGACPLHIGHNASQFRVSISKNCWHCFGNCKRGGNVLDFVSIKENVNIREAALMIQKWFGANPTQEIHKPPLPPPDRPPEPPPQVAQPLKSETKVEPPKLDDNTPNKPLGFSLKKLSAEHPYLTSRGLKKETVEYFGLGFCEKGVMAGHIAIPIHNIHRQLMGYAGRWPGDPPDGQSKYKLPQGFKKSLEIFNIHQAVKEEATLPLVVVEGYFDCMALWQSGYRKVVAVMGSTVSAEQMRMIAEVVTPTGKVILLFDGDESGIEGAKQAASLLSQRVYVKIITLENGKQPDQLTTEEITSLLR